MSTAAGTAPKFKPRNLVILSDGTGNSAAKLFRTNIWRIYEALDLNCDDQVALYDDGVGTSSFKPLAILGGAFGYGLKRNVLDLYTFLCRNYKADNDYHYDPERPSADVADKHDKIFAFGFSRGAFTARVVTSLVAHEGLIHRAETDAELSRLALWAYRSYRAKRYRNQLGVKALRWLRDRVFRLFEWRKPAYDRRKNRDVPIDFLGAFDTVAAYGFPIDELTRGWDRWVWPMTPRDNALHQNVKYARHALAIDDERQTFFPLLWDEDSVVEQRKNTAFRHPADRIKQVWFAGMHSNIGGGYADDALSLGPLCWVAGEAAAHGLRFQSGIRPSNGPIPDTWVERAAACAPMGDSRQGVAAYYRYHPRPIARFCGFQDHSTEPNPTSRTRIDLPKIHESVFERVRDSRDNYAPFGLPQKYAVLTRRGEVLAGDADATPASAHPNPFEHSTQAASRVLEQQSAWDAVWTRRVTYFLTVGTTILLLVLPSIPLRAIPGDESATLHTAFTIVRGFLPGFAQGLLDAYKDRPGSFFLVVSIVLVWLWTGSRLRRTVNDRMGEVWAKREGLHAVRWNELAPAPSGWVYHLRESPWYKGAFRFLSDKVWPNVFGGAIVLLLLTVVPLRLAYQVSSRLGGFGTERGGGTDVPHEVIFYPDEINRRTGIQIAANRRYAIQIAMPAESCEDDRKANTELKNLIGGWHDASIPVPSTTGIPSPPVKMAPFVPFRRILGLNWFVPVAAIGRTVPERHYLTSATTEFTATRSGLLSFYVNDAAFPLSIFDGGCFLHWDCYYRNNSGGPARVRVTELDGNTSTSSVKTLVPYSCAEQVPMAVQETEARKKL